MRRNLDNWKYSPCRLPSLLLGRDKWSPYQGNPVSYQTSSRFQINCSQNSLTTSKRICQPLYIYKVYILIIADRIQCYKASFHISFDSGALKAQPNRLSFYGTSSSRQPTHACVRDLRVRKFCRQADVTPIKGLPMTAPLTGLLKYLKINSLTSSSLNPTAICSRVSQGVRTLIPALCRAASTTRRFWSYLQPWARLFKNRD